jgi:hypothetical protein
MTTDRREIAKKAAHEAATAAYEAVMNAPVRKVAGTKNYRNPDPKDVAKAAAAAAYNGVIKQAQMAAEPPPNPIGGAARPLGIRLRMTPSPDAPTIATAIESPGEPVNLDAVEAEWPRVAAATTLFSPEEIGQMQKELRTAGARV